MNSRCLLFLLGFQVLACTSTPAADQSERRRVALVFDDGPVADQTRRYLDLLARENVHVTFAYVGRNVTSHPQLAQAATAAGHEIINHSYTHPHFKELTDEAVEREVRDTQASVKKSADRTPRWFWSPFGDWDDRIEAAVRAAGLEHYPALRFHFISTEDWNRDTTAEQIRERATTGVRDKTIILCHEWREETLAELPAILAELKRQGCEFLTFSELAALPEE